jgi:hypothetical protein
MWNTTIIALGTTVLALLLGTPAAYALARFRVGSAEQISFGVLSVRIVPSYVAVVPLFIILQQINLFGTALGVIVAGSLVGISFVIWMMRAFFAAIPPEIEDAAMMDGCSRVGAIWRVALPLAARGVRVEGIDASAAMVEQLRGKPGGAEMRVSLGDFAAVEVEGRFRLIYVVFNTLFALLEQEEQVGCFRSVARHLAEDGAFVVEAFVPDPTLYDRSQRVSATRVEVDRVAFDAARIDLASQRITTQHVLIGREGITLLPVQLRYAWPSELDLMARLAGLELRERFAGWRREAFTSTSPGHVSVYGRRTADGSAW